MDSIFCLFMMYAKNASFLVSLCFALLLATSSTKVLALFSVKHILHRKPNLGGATNERNKILI
jgi:hypothetical protein